MKIERRRRARRKNFRKDFRILQVIGICAILEFKELNFNRRVRGG